MHVQKHSTPTINSGLSLSLFLSRYDVQHACTETLDTDNIFGSLFLSLVMTYNMHVQKNSTLTIYSGHSLSLSLSLYDVQHECTETLDTDNIFAPLSRCLVMTYNMHVQKHTILTIYSCLSPSLSLWRTSCMYRNTRSWHYIRSTLSLSLSFNVQHACT